MKTIFTLKKCFSPHLFLLSVLIFLFTSPGFSSIKHSVAVTNYQFTPSDLQITVGDTVEWKNTQGFHNVNGTKTEFPSNPESFGNSTGSGWTYKYVFKTAGKYEYQCDPHASGGMVGKLEVKEAGGNTGKFNLTINFTGMTPHVGQTLWLNVVDKTSGKEVERKKQIVTTQFSLVVSGTEKDHSYFVNFYSDHNKNGNYDAPPVDHAWRMELNNVTGESTLNFAHNTSFTDIQWKNKLTVHFMAMNPHIGQTMKLAVIDKNSGMELGRVSAIGAADYMIDIYGIEKGKSYNVDFFSDHNKNGVYNAPPVDHAWRLQLDNVNSDTTLNFTHNTSFTDIKWKNKLTVHFMAMNPHVGQTMKLAVIDKNSGMELGRVTAIGAVDYMVDIYGIEKGKSYNVDFFSDHNKNGVYNAPPADHAWRLLLNNVNNDTTLNFTHNTSFTDIQWKNQLTIHFMGMTPHVGQNLWLSVIDKISGISIDTVITTAQTEFMVNVIGTVPGKSYNIDFYADHNKNGKYDVPPADHAWRMTLENVVADTILMFTHNTSFTDIFKTTSNKQLQDLTTKMYPNPATDRIYIETGEVDGHEIIVSIFDITGKLKHQVLKPSENKIEIDVHNLSNGIYFVELKSNNNKSLMKLVKH